MSDFNILEVDDDALKKVVKFFGTTVTEFHKNTTKLKIWMRSQHHFPEIMNDKKIQNFLILNKNDVEKAKVKIDAYYSMRTNWSDIFEKSNPLKFEFVEDLHQAFYFVPLPKLTKNMCRIFVFKIRNKDLAAGIDVWNVLRYMVNGQEIRLQNDICYGDIFIVDAQDIPMRLILNTTPLWIYRSIKIYQEVFSLRVKGVYFINASAAIKNLLLILKGFVKQKIFDRVQCCEGYEFLKTTFESRILPKDYGGEERSLEEIQDMWYLKGTTEYVDFFDKLDELKVDESLRPIQTQRSGLLRYFSFGGFDTNEMM